MYHASRDSELLSAIGMILVSYGRTRSAGVLVLVGRGTVVPRSIVPTLSIKESCSGLAVRAVEDA